MDIGTNHLSLASPFSNLDHEGLQQQHVVNQIDQQISYLDRSWQYPCYPGSCMSCILDILCCFPWTFCALGEVANRDKDQCLSPGQLYNRRKVNQLKLKLETLKFANKYESSGLIEEQEIIQLMKNVDKTARQELFKELNFEQLFYARQVVDQEEFKQYVVSTDKKQHKQWLSILTLLEQSEPQQFVNQLKAKAIRVIQETPFIGTVICQEWERIHKTSLKAFVKSDFFFALYSQPDNEQEIEIVIPGHSSLKANKSLLSKNCGFFKQLFEKEMKEKDSNTITIKIETKENFEDFKLFIQLLNGEPLEWDLEMAAKLIPVADAYSAERVLEHLDRYVATHAHEFSLEELRELILAHGSLKNTRDYLDHRLLGYKLTENNWDQYWNDVVQLNLTQLKAKCLYFTREMIQKNLDNDCIEDSASFIIWLERCHQFLPSESYKTLINETITKIKIDNFIVIYEVASRIKDSKLQEACIDYCRQHVEEFKKSSFWALGGEPPELSAILYPFIPTKTISW